MNRSLKKLWAVPILDEPMNVLYHTPVLLHESITGLNINPGGIYADVTFGGGGHAKAILNQLVNGKLLAFDQDAEAEINVPDDPRLIFFRKNFRHLKKEINNAGITSIDGLIADLGISSRQIDTAARGFSTRFDAVLDMRMNASTELTAEIILNEYKGDDLLKVFRNYGELKNSRAIVNRIINERDKKRISTVNELKKILESMTTYGKDNKFLARVFQALRMEVNDELNALKEFLAQCSDVISRGGRLVVISYHSLEDRLVKNFIRSGNFSGTISKDLYGNVQAPFHAINKKPIQPSETEIMNNPRSRSARLRIAERN